jgi:hypothetical protein
MVATVAFAASGVTGCTEATSDPAATPQIPPPTGKGLRIREVRDPASPTKAAHKSKVALSGSVVIAVDRFDETRNGKSSGAIYVADLDLRDSAAQESDPVDKKWRPYSGVSLFNPSFIPGNLRVSPGDVLDLRGEFQENQDVPLLFPKNAFLVQLSAPIGTFRFEGSMPPPVELSSIAELSTYESGRRWLNMLVTVKDVVLERDAFGDSKSGRISSALMPEAAPATACDSPFPKAPTLVNELMDLSSMATLKKGTKLASLTGVVTFFCNLHIAPRSAEDIVVAPAPSP